MFNLDNYEDVQSRIRRFQVAFPVGRIVTDVIQFNAEKGHVLVSAQIYREYEDTLPSAVDYAFGDASTFNASMRKFYVEDTVTSAIGRALSLVLETEKKPTVQDMARVQISKAKDKEYIPVVNEEDPWTIKAVEMPNTIDKAVDTVKEIIGTKSEIPKCPTCGKDMIWKTGVSKHNKPWGNFQCKRAVGSGICNEIQWYELAPNGSWTPQKVRS